MYNPISTYRVQFNKNFTLSDLEKIIPYLKNLGIKTIYASPILKALPGSNHGYDTLDPKKINPEIGTEDQLLHLQKKLKENNIGWLQDIVPNHMAFHPGNPWLNDILEKGIHSQYASYFDIDWTQPPLMLPVLGKSLEEAVEQKEIQVQFRNGKFFLSYFDHCYPVQPATYFLIIDQLLQNSEFDLNELNKEIIEKENSDNIHKVLETFNQNLKIKTSKPGFKNEIDKVLIELNNNKKLVLEIINQQFYRLCHWQETDHHINFRRFFTINGLICLNIQDETVFNDFHSYIKSLIDKNVINGLRVDHVDGLYNPSHYLNQLRSFVGDEAYVVVEKILEKDEKLLEEWPIQGTTGYEFLATVNNLFTEQNSEEIFSQSYSSITDTNKSIGQQIKDKKSFILYNYMQGELNNLYKLLWESDVLLEQEKIISSDDLKEVIAKFLIHCPVYRFYSNSFPIINEEKEILSDIFLQLHQSQPELEKAIHVLERLFLPDLNATDNIQQNNAAHFFQRCMQFTGPLMAKGVEDTLMYTYNRFIAHNEVGDAPASFGCSAEEYHLRMQERQRQWPLSLNATATHDTKRGEDARARLNVLSDIPTDWFKKVDEWQKMASRYKTNNAPDANDEYFIYQSFIASHPMPGEDEDNFKERIIAYLQKAFREAKRHTNWNAPNEAYEQATSLFIEALFKNNIYKSLKEFLASIADYGIINSLVQLTLKCTCPGLPDIYQGTEFWDLSLVDPDNRRQVDYKRRNKFLQEAKQQSLENLWLERFNGKIKLRLLNTLLRERNAEPEIFLKGSYLPLQVSGKYKKHIIAFARQHEGKSFLVIAPLHLAALCKQQKKQWQQLDWKDTKIELPDSISGEAYSVVDDQQLDLNENISANDLFLKFPLSLFKVPAAKNKRGSGILLHITSLPSDFGIGDLGKESRQFADFLNGCKQKYWQILPLNPVEEGQGFSPYSSTSSMAGNTLLISPTELVKEGLLMEENLAGFHLPLKAKVNFRKAETIRNVLFKIAWQNFNEKTTADNKTEFEIFCENEKDWLNDYTFYTVLKKQFKNKPWYEWPVAYKQRYTDELSKLASRKAEEITYQKWLQFIFHKQWHHLRSYCNKKGIQLFGDLPIYISYDSADVWSHKHLFKLDKEGNKLGMAGVPPDAFSADGQLWGMPVFDWKKMKEENYKWWVQRLKKNIELFDVVRLDHFRAFSAYWEVAAGEVTAKKGKWKQGPGKDFFEAVKEQIGNLPFVAEDLGDIDEAVYDLRDAYKFPGMKVLQFAFGNDMPLSTHIPHNYDKNFVVYTGTHDNNTTKGWYRQDENSRINLEKYLNKKVSEKDVAAEMMKLAFASVANIAIIPLQDVIGLDESARMNMPSSSSGNWNWKLVPGQINEDVQKRLLILTETYNRS